MSDCWWNHSGAALRCFHGGDIAQNLSFFLPARFTPSSHYLTACSWDWSCVGCSCFLRRDGKRLQGQRPSTQAHTSWTTAVLYIDFFQIQKRQQGLRGATCLMSSDQFYIVTAFSLPTGGLLWPQWVQGHGHIIKKKLTAFKDTFQCQMSGLN